MRRARLRLALWACAFAALAAGCSPGAPRPIRIVLITLDTLRFDHLLPSQGTASAMPLTWERARRGTPFASFYAAAPVTQPTHATIFTGLQPWEHGLTRNGLVLDEKLPTVVEVLSRHGFETQAVVASFPLTARFGFARGFDRYVEDFSLEYHLNAPRWEGRWEVPGGVFYALGDAITERALEALDRAQGEKQFFWFHYFDPHSPYGSSQGKQLTRTHILRRNRTDGPEAAQEVLGRARRLYGADVAYLDRALDRVLARLAEDEHAFETHVFVLADHGESFGEGGSLGHGFRLSPEQIHVPAFALSPKLAPGMRRDLASTVDVAPTLLAWAGISAEGLGLGGRDLAQPAGDEVRAFAMRKTFRGDRGREARLDGRHRIEGLLFGAIEPDGKIYRGNGAGFAEGDGAAPPAPEAAAVIERFRSFEAQLRGVPQPVEPLDPEVQQGLDALGYGS